MFLNESVGRKARLINAGRHPSSREFPLLLQARETQSASESIHFGIWFRILTKSLCSCSSARSQPG
jgi:hypothetical protein